MKNIKWTRETTKRVFKTFLQAALAYMAMNLAGIDFTGDRDMVKTALIGLALSSISAGIAALMNLQSPAEPEQLGGASALTFEAWIKKYLGKKTDYDGAYGVQCVDLIDCYIDKCLGLKKGFWGNAKNWWTDRSKSTWLKNNFEFITPKYKNGELKAGDIGIRTSGTYGHIFIVAEPSSNGQFKYYDQNAAGKHEAMTLRTKAFTSENVNGILRPKNQTPFKTEKKPAASSFKKGDVVTLTTNVNVRTGAGTNSYIDWNDITSKSSYPTPVKWQNGRTKETVFEQNNLKEELGSLSAKEAAQCYGKAGNGYVVVYELNGTDKHKAGFVSYAGGVTKAPTAGKTWTNGSTKETVYADTAKRTEVGILNPKESCTCLGKIDGMYFVLYKVDGTSNYKCGFVTYAGGC